MIIAYLYERPTSEGEEMGAERTFADYSTTRRIELVSLIDKDGLRSGDILRIRAISDLGKGREAQRIQNRIAAIGATIEVMPKEGAVRTQGRPSPIQVRDWDTFDLLCGLWYSAADAAHCYKRGSEITEQDMDRNAFNYLCGPRSGKKSKQKRDAMSKKLEHVKEADQ